MKKFTKFVSAVAAVSLVAAPMAVSADEKTFLLGGSGPLTGAAASYGTGGKAWNYRPYPLFRICGGGAAARTVPQRGCLYPADQRGLFRTRDLRGDVRVASGDLLTVRRRCV